MASTRYLEIDSTYRNRSEYSSPANFTVEISQTGTKGREQALDPVSNAAPILEWHNSFQENSLATSVNDISMSPVFLPSQYGNTTFQINSSTGTFRQVKNYYIGACIYVVRNTNLYMRRIISYTPIDIDTALITLDSPMADEAFATTTAVIQNPSLLATTTANAVINLFIPNGSNIDNFYNGYYVHVLAAGVNPEESRLITSYSGTTHLATLESATTYDWVANYSNFSIRRELPTMNGAIYGISTNLRNIQLDVDLLPNTSLRQYNNWAIRMIVPVPVFPLSTIVAPFQQQLIIGNYVGATGTFLAGSAGTTAVLNVDFDLTNCWITNTTIAAPHSTAFILSYSNGIATTGAWSGAGPTVGDTFVIATAILREPMEATVPLYTANTYELEAFTRENAVPFSYSGSLVSSQQEVCYEVNLLNIVIPNGLLESGRGGKALLYPYFYVELRPVSSATSFSDVIYSNNPNAKNKLFRAILNNNASSFERFPFVWFDSDGMVQTIKFKPNDSFHFALYHPNGSLFQTVEVDTSPPVAPNPNVQISACFSIKKL